MFGQPTLYQIAREEMHHCIDAYLSLAERSKGLTAVLPEHLSESRGRVLVMAGLGMVPRPMTADDVFAEWQRRQALAFDVEAGITAGVYQALKGAAETCYDELDEATAAFSHFDAEFISENPRVLPFLQHLGGVFSKAKLKSLVGSVSDTRISRPAAERLARLLSERVDPVQVVKREVMKRLETTLEGMVRDLVGRVLLESIVDTALRRRGLTFLREAQYAALAGVVYNMRADFVLPDATMPRAFIEVRKSSSRHASLYAKDKMFSAINWKGKSDQLLAALVVDGEWTAATLRALANVFDYVVPIGRVDELVQSIEAYLQGDRTKLKWLIEFRIEPA